MKNKIILNLVASLLGGVMGSHVDAAKVKEATCYNLTVDNTNGTFDVQLNYAPCSNWGSPQYDPVKAGSPPHKVQAYGLSSFIISKCNTKGKCGEHDSLTPLLPSNPSYPPAIRKDYTITCSEGSCLSNPPYRHDDN